jgi:hypothetical protein
MVQPSQGQATEEISPSMTHLYVFGSGDCGQLGLGEDVDLKARPFLHPFFSDKNIVSIAAGGMHSLALSGSGEVPSVIPLLICHVGDRFTLGDVMMRRPLVIAILSLMSARLLDWRGRLLSRLLLVIPSRLS